MEKLMTFERFKVSKTKKWKRKIQKNKRLNSRKPVLEPINPDEMVAGRSYDQTEMPIPGNFTINI